MNGIDMTKHVFMNEWKSVAFFSKNKGKVFEADTALIPSSEAETRFPNLTCYTLDNEQRLLPNSIPAKAKLITFCFKDNGNQATKSWSEAFIHHFPSKGSIPASISFLSSTTSTLDTAFIDIFYIEHSFLSYFKGSFISSLKRKTPDKLHGTTGLVFGGASVS